MNNSDINNNNIIKTILSKIPLFIICVLFINGYNTFTSGKNSITCLIILIAILVTLKSRFELANKYVAMGLPILFISFGLLAKLSLINPYLGIILNLITMFALMLFTGGDTSESCYLPFAMGYIMFQGYDVTGNLFNERMISLIIGGAVLGILYFAINSKNNCSVTLSQYLKQQFCNTEKRQKYIKLALTLATATFICQLIHFPKYMWINLTILSLMNPMIENSHKRKIARIPAAVIGSSIFYIVFEHLIPAKLKPVIILIAGFASMFISDYFIKSIYNSFSALCSCSILYPALTAVKIRITANITGVITVIIFEIILNSLLYFVNKNKLNKAV